MQGRSSAARPWRSSASSAMEVRIHSDNRTHREFHHRERGEHGGIGASSGVYRTRPGSHSVDWQRGNLCKFFLTQRRRAAEGMSGARSAVMRKHDRAAHERDAGGATLDVAQCKAPRILELAKWQSTPRSRSRPSTTPYTPGSYILPRTGVALRRLHASRGNEATSPM